MATIGDSITGDENVNPEFPTDLTVATNPGLISSGSHEERVETFLRRMLPVVSDAATHPVQALVPWVCDVLQSKQSLEVYGQDIRDFTAHMQRFGISRREVKADRDNVKMLLLTQIPIAEERPPKAVECFTCSPTVFSEKNHEFVSLDTETSSVQKIAVEFDTVCVNY